MSLTILKWLKLELYLMKLWKELRKQRRDPKNLKLPGTMSRRLRHLSLIWKIDSKLRFQLLSPIWEQRSPKLLKRLKPSTNKRKLAMILWKNLMQPFLMPWNRRLQRLPRIWNSSKKKFRSMRKVIKTCTKMLHLTKLSITQLLSKCTSARKKWEPQAASLTFIFLKELMRQENFSKRPWRLPRNLELEPKNQPWLGKLLRNLRPQSHILKPNAKSD